MQLDTFQNCLCFKPHYRDVDCFSIVVSISILFFFSLSLFNFIICFGSGQNATRASIRCVCVPSLSSKMDFIHFHLVFTIIHLHLLVGRSVGCFTRSLVRSFVYSDEDHISFISEMCWILGGCHVFVV